MERVFVDTDVILDLLADRKPYHDDSARLFSMADAGAVAVHISALTIANLHYILCGTFLPEEARRRLMQFKTLVTVLPLTDKIVDLALSSTFRDVEDAMQYFTATENNIQTLLTRNLKDYKTATISVLTPDQYLKGRLI